MSLKSCNKAEEANLYTLEVSIDGATFNDAMNRAFQKQKNRIALPGFRKGKVTRKMAEAFYGKGFLYEDALDLCYTKAVEDAIAESGLDVVGTKSADIKEIGEDGVELVVELYVKPTVEVQAYKELKATKKKVEASEEEIDAKVDELVKRNARISAVEDRPAQDGDIAVIDFEGFVDGVAFEGGKGENYELKLGSGTFIPGFEDQIIGHSVEDSFDVNVTFPHEYAEELADKAAVFKVTLHEIKQEEFPDVDDEFAQDAADCDTVADLRKQLADEIKKEKEDANDHEIRTQLFERLVENTVVEIPPVMIDAEVENQIRDMDYRLSSQGMNFQTYLQYMGMDLDAYKEQMRPEAEKAVKLRLALETVAALEGIEVTDEEVDAEYAKYAEQYKMELEQIQKLIPVDGLKKDMAVERAIQVIRDSAKITTARKPRAPKEKTEAAAESDTPAE